MGEIMTALIGSTLTRVVVFLPSAFLNGVHGVFFRALGLTMVVALLVSLVLAVTLTPLPRRLADTRSDQSPFNRRGGRFSS